MVANNGNDKGGRISFLARLRGKSKEEIREDLKDELKKEAVLESHAEILAAGAEIFTRIPYFMYTAHSAASRFEESNLPISSVLVVGGLTGKTIGHMNDWRYLVENLSRAKEGNKEIESRIQEKRYSATRGYDDIDGFATFNVEIDEDKLVFGASYKESLQLHMPESIKGFGWEFHEDCLKTDNEFEKLVDDYKNHFVFLLKKHEKEILLSPNDPDKGNPDIGGVVPVVLYARADSKVRPILQQLIAGGNVRPMRTYFKETFLPWANDYKATFPETADRIIGNVISEVKSDGLTEEDKKKCLDVYSRIGDIGTVKTDIAIKSPIENMYNLE